MALINCPECGKEISDKSTACVHCGYPITAEPATVKKNKISIDSISQTTQKKKITVKNKKRL